MNNKINNFLLGLLWLTVSTLGLCFWFNVNFGFNLLSGAHWRHLAYMQASQQPIKFSFYASLIIGIGLIIIGLYTLIRPKLRKIKFTKKKTPDTTSPVPPAPVATPVVAPVAAPIATPVVAPTAIIAPVDEFAHTQRNTPHGALSNLDYNSDIPPAPVVAPAAPTAQQNMPKIEIQDSTTIQDYPEIIEIFQDAGYTIKEPPTLAAFRPALTAVGNDTILWVGAVDVGTEAVQGIIDAFKTIFDDTLEGVEIDTRGFVINATDKEKPKAPDILRFDTIDDLRDYMQEHKNPIDEDDTDGEGFEAYSSYISTVIKHMGNI